MEQVNVVSDNPYTTEDNTYKLLSEMPTGLGGKWVLIKYSDNFYAYGVEQCLHDFLGFPVEQCGTKEKVMAHCKSISKLCEQNIQSYTNNSKSSDSKGWNVLIDHEQKELEMLIEFIKVLSNE